MSDLAILGGPKAVQTPVEDMFTWPIITQEDEEACLEVLRRGGMSGTDVTAEFEKEYAAWFGVKHALGCNTGTAALQAAMWAAGVGVGDEIISVSLTYWATNLPVFSLGATVVFADVERDTMCMDPADIEHRITDKTKAIVPVHYCGYPCDMDAIMKLADKHNLIVIEDVSHAHGAEWKGKLCGTFGQIGAMSTMSGKALPIGEGGFLITDDDLLYERAEAWGHYERTGQLTDPTLKHFAGLPWGGYKYRMHQLSSAVGRVQLKHYRARMEEILKSMQYFWDLLEGVPGIRAHRPAKETGSHCGGWYAAHGLYRPEELNDLPIATFCKAVTAEGCGTSPGCNFALHLHPLYNEADIYGHGKPTRIANSQRDVREGPGSLPITEQMQGWTYGIPWFKHYRPQVIEEHAIAFRKVAENADELIAEFGTEAEAATGSAGLFNRR
jgi:dTDP-4-amino-4,6-dideoxygalactose transaminase